MHDTEAHVDQAVLEMQMEEIKERIEELSKKKK